VQETLILGLIAFGVLFAATSAIHSFLIVAYSDEDKVALNVGFYYMANAAGRLAGTILSGTLFQMAGQGTEGLVICLLASASFVLVSSFLCVPLGRHARELTA
jgi:MFS family permease